MIELSDVTKRYGDSVAVDHLSFTVKPGMVTGFLGPNGAGKTTTMRMVLGLDAPDSGAVTVNGRRYRSIPAPMHELGALLDAKAANGGHTARQHLAWIARAGGIPAHRIDEVLDLVGLLDVAAKRLAGFSLGMFQRLGIATALLGDPQILVLDEPVNGLDPDGIRWIRALLQQLAAEGRTIFLSSHLMSEMEATADHIIVIGRGRLIADTSIAEFTQRSTSSHVRVVSPQAHRLAPLLQRAGATIASAEGALIVTGIDAALIGRLAAANGIEIHELAERRASLETAFMELTQNSQEYQTSSPAPAAKVETARTLVGMETRS
ncbi:MAG TPA: ATP-binding cassette domain-containing protein [Tepidiformaceae bacterium]|nr:ATP-binding cassette domain-containing protein [Tepidiformaceae bacterium]